MSRAYRTPEIDEAALALGRKIVDILMEAKVPYSKAEDALAAAEKLLGDETMPVNVQSACDIFPS